MPVITDYTRQFDELFTPDALLAVYEAKFRYNLTKGVDRVNGVQFASRAQELLTNASQKILNGTYRFTPYRENLLLKGRGSSPRLIAIPSVRDRIVLNQLKECLFYAFSECVPRNIASGLIRTVIYELMGLQSEITYVCGCDLKDFYGSIDRIRLLNIIRSRLGDSFAVSLIRRSLLTPTVPNNASHRDYRRYLNDRGIPQGLSISNILAAIYVRDVDVAMESLGVNYHRYVDDILMYGNKEDVQNAHKTMLGRFRRRKLSVHPLGNGKSHFSTLTKPFGYLGYYFRWPLITVRDSTVERLLQSIAAKFSDYLHNKDIRLRRFKYLTADRQKDIFLQELNERITGAISEGKRYGWMAYFSEINDLTLLHKLDAIVTEMFKRLPDFSGAAPGELKKFSRAYYEMKFNPHGNYLKTTEFSLI